MLGVWPASGGKVRFDGADIAHLPRAAIGPHIGYLPQEVELFPGTVAENIARMGTPDTESVLEAARWGGPPRDAPAPARKAMTPASWPAA